MIRTGLVGLGKMGISHCAVLNTHPDVKLAAICDSSHYILDVLSKYTGLATFTDFQRMIDEVALDCIVIATPSRFHGDMVRRALDHNLHVFCEKPFCLDVQEGEALARLAQSKNLVSQVGYHYRFVETFRETKRLLNAGVLGKIHHIRAEAYGPVVLRPSGSTWRTSKTAGGGCLYDYACHAIDLVNYLVGPPSGTSGIVLKKLFSSDVEDEVYATLHFADGKSGQLSVNWSDESYRKMSTKITVWGTNGRIAVDRQECQIYLRSEVKAPINLTKGWTIRYTTDLIEPVWFYLRGEEYSSQIAHFMQCIRGAVPSNISSFASAVETDRVVSSMLERAEAAGMEQPMSAGSSAPTRKNSRIAFLRRRLRWSL